MSYYSKKTFMISCMLVLGAQPLFTDAGVKKPTVLIVLGSARTDTLGKKIFQSITKLSDGTCDYKLIDLKEYALPLVDLDIQTLPTPGIERWRNTFQDAAAVIFLVPNYNAGYPGIVKNALDALADTAKSKPVALIAYSGGYDGGQEAVDALLPVFKSLKVNLLDTTVRIRMADGAFDDAGALKSAETEKDIATLLTTVSQSLPR